MGSLEFILCFIMIEGESVFECLCVMAKSARLRRKDFAELVGVNIFMTIHAELKIRGFELKDLFFGWAMAVVALCRDVSPS